MSFPTHPAPKRMLDLPAADTETRSVAPRRARPRAGAAMGRRLVAGAGALTAAAVIGSVAATTASAAPLEHGPSHTVSSSAHPYRHGYRHHAHHHDSSSTGGSSSSTSTTSSTSAASESTSAVGSDGLSANTTAVMKAVKAKWPSVTFSTDGDQDHATGHAVDIMIPNPTTAAGKQTGDEIAAYLKANQSTFHIHYLIWQQRIWNIQRDSEGWRAMADRGSATANHYDHVHVSVY